MWKTGDIGRGTATPRRACSHGGSIVARLAALLLLAATGFASAGPLPRNWPMAPSELERRFGREDFTILEAKEAGSGVTGAWKLLLDFPDGRRLTVKWKAAPPGRGDAWNNSPRKELAVYEIQRWLFEENDFVVPTVALACLPMEKARAIEANAKPTLAGTSCVLGTISVWMQDVTAPKDAYEKKRFERDPLYARRLADLNLLTYLVGHRDSHEGNLLVSKDPGDPRIYAVDNGISFDLLPWNLRVFNWFRIRVPWLRRETVDRLRLVDRGKVRALTVVAELEADATGMLHVVPPTSNFDPRGHDGVRRRGNRIQLGLTEDEDDDLGDRMDKLLKKVDTGRQPVR